MWVHFDVEDSWVACHGRAGRENSGFALRADASGMNVREVDAPLLPACRYQIRSDEGKQGLAMTIFALAEQNVRLGEPSDGAVRRQLAADDSCEGRRKSLMENIA